jgi:menaquinone-9 beta-reductase
VIESYLELRDDRGGVGGLPPHKRPLLPGYGWIFPMGDGRINVGVGILSTYKGWQKVNNAHLMGAFMRALPKDWNLPAIESLREGGQLKGWRLPMGFAVTPPWRPGVLAVGDAAGVVNPFNGEGISEAVESAVIAVETGLKALGGSGPRDLSAYERELDALWGPYYRLGRTFVKLIGNPKVMRVLTNVGMRVPPVMEFAFKLLANLYREQGGTPGDALARSMLKAASVIKVG